MRKRGNEEGEMSERGRARGVSFINKSQHPPAEDGRDASLPSKSTQIVP